MGPRRDNGSPRSGAGRRGRVVHYNGIVGQYGSTVGSEGADKLSISMLLTLRTTHVPATDLGFLLAGRFGYRVRYLPVGEEDPELGPPTQMAVFERGEGAGA